MPAEGTITPMVEEQQPLTSVMYCDCSSPLSFQEDLLPVSGSGHDEMMIVLVVLPTTAM